MGIPGAGKSRVADEYVARGYLRLNRDERGGSLRELAGALDEALSSGSRRIVLDNTYLARAARNDVIEAAGRHRVPTRCVWLDTPLAAGAGQPRRAAARARRLAPEPEQLRELARREPGVLAPTSQMRAARELEPPSADEGFAAVEQVPFCAGAGRGPRGGRSSRRPRSPSPGWETALEQATGARRTSSSTGAPTATRRRWPPASPASRPGHRTGRGRALPTRRRAADLLVQAAASGAAARLRACARHRRVAVASDRGRACAPHAREALGARYVPVEKPDSST